MDEEFYRIYDETYGTSYSLPSTHSPGADVPQAVLEVVKQMEVLLNDVDYGKPWRMEAQKMTTDRAGKEVCLCILTNTQSGARYKIQLSTDQPVQGLYDWVESQYGHLRRIFHGLHDWERQQAQQKVQEFDQLPEDMKRMIVQKFSQP